MTLVSRDSHDLNFSNRPVRTRMPGGVAGAQSIMAAPCADSVGGGAIKLMTPSAPGLPRTSNFGGFTLLVKPCFSQLAQIRVSAQLPA